MTKTFQLESRNENKSKRGSRISFFEPAENNEEGVDPSFSLSLSAAQAAALGIEPGQKFTLSLSRVGG